MSRLPILDPQTSYTFSKYFELSYDPEDIFAELGCTLENTVLTFPKPTQPVTFADELHRRLERALRLIDLTSEIARRETLIAPILFSDRAL